MTIALQSITSNNAIYWHHYKVIYMAITYLPKYLDMQFPVSCALCRVSVSADKATAGSYSAENKPVFACVSHFSEVDLLIASWANFIAEEKCKYLSLGKEPNNLMYGN